MAGPTYLAMDCDEIVSRTCTRLIVEYCGPFYAQQLQFELSKCSPLPSTSGSTTLYVSRPSLLLLLLVLKQAPDYMW